MSLQRNKIIRQKHL